MSQELKFFDKKPCHYHRNLESKEVMTIDQFILLFMMGFAAGISAAVIIKGKSDVTRNETIRNILHNLKRAYIKKDVKR